MEIRWNGKREAARSYLSEVLDICNEAGHRVSSVLNLRRDNVQLDKGVHGLIEWLADTDKEGRASLVPITPTVRAAIERRLRDRPTIGQAYLFPSPSDPNQPVKLRLALAWLRKAERLAGLEHIPHGGFHMFRRKWATERKELSAIDVAAAGGWATVETLQRVYQKADRETMFEVVMNPRPLREAR
jgi:integrase